MRRDGRLFWCVGILLVWITLSTIVGVIHSREISLQRQQAEANQREQWLNKKTVGAHMAAHQGLVVFRPNFALSAFDQGLNDYVGASMFLEAHRRSEFQNKEIEQTGLLIGFGQMSVALTLQLILPLLIVLLAYPAIAGERENGTLRQIISLGISKKELFVGKALGVFFPLAATLSLLLVIFFGLSLMNGENSPDLGRIVIFLVSYSVYAAIFLGFCLVVSALASSTRVSLAILLTFWLLSCLVIPKIASDLGEIFYKTPTEADLQAMLPDKEQSRKQYLEETEQLKKELMAKYNVNDVNKLPVRFSAIMLDRSEDSAAKINKAIFDRVYDQYGKQNSLYQILGFLAPTLSIQTISMNAAGEDVFHYRHFADSAEEYRFRFVRLLNEYSINHPLKSNLDESVKEFQKNERELYESIEPFVYEKPTTIWLLDKTKNAIAGLLFWLGLISAAAVWSVRKMEVI